MLKTSWYKQQCLKINIKNVFILNVETLIKYNLYTIETSMASKGNTYVVSIGGQLILSWMGGD